MYIYRRTALESSGDLAVEMRFYSSQELRRLGGDGIKIVEFGILSDKFAEIFRSGGPGG